MTRSLALVGGLALSGCVMPNMTMPVPSTHALDPDATVEPVTEVRAEASRVCGVAGFVDENPDEILLRHALRRGLDANPDVDALIDAVVSSHVSNYLLFSRCHVEIHGTGVHVNAPTDAN